MREQLRIGSRLCWAVAWALALAGTAAYLLWPNDLVWWIAPAGAGPLILLTEWRREKKGFPEVGAGVAGSDNSAWGPPADHPLGL